MDVHSESKMADDVRRPSSEVNDVMTETMETDHCDVMKTDDDVTVKQTDVTETLEEAEETDEKETSGDAAQCSASNHEIVSDQETRDVSMTKLAVREVETLQNESDYEKVEDLGSKVVYVRADAIKESESVTITGTKARKTGFSGFKDSQGLKSINLAPLANLTLDMTSRSASPMSQPSPYQSDRDGDSSTASLRDPRTDVKRKLKRKKRRLGQYKAGLVPQSRLRAMERQRLMRKTRRAGGFNTGLRASSDSGLRAGSDIEEEGFESFGQLSTSGGKKPQVVNVLFNAPPGGETENQQTQVPPDRFVIAPGTVALKSLSPTKRPFLKYHPQNVLKLLNPEDVGASAMTTDNVAMTTTTGSAVAKGPSRQRMYKLIYPSATQAQALLQASGLAHQPIDSAVTSPIKRLATRTVSSNKVSMVTETIGSTGGGIEEKTSSERDVPLCCCRIGGTVFSNLTKVSFCQALDSVDGKPVGCSNPVTSSARSRPATRIPFMTLCEIHKERLRVHQCCPGCGQFCTQGKFYKCKKESTVVHYFHKTCQTYQGNHGNRAYCPHCGELSAQIELDLVVGQAKENERNRVSSTGSQRAKMGQSYRSAKPDPDDLPAPQTPIQTLRAGDKTISSQGIPFGPQRAQLEHLLVMIDYHKPKKIRSTQKSLYNQACAGDLERVLHLIGEGFDVNYRYPDINNQCALHAAATNGHYLVCHVLIQAGANVNEVDNDLVSPLMKAAEKNRLDIMKLLIIAGANVGAKGEDGMSTLHIAAKDGHFEVVKYLLETGKSDVNIVDEGGWTALIWASEHRRIDIVRYLLEHGADCNMKDNEENIALHWAAYSGSVDIAELFLDHFSDLETANEHGDRPLHIATRQDHYQCVVLFLARGADAGCTNSEGQTPIQCCRSENSPVWMALRVNKQIRHFSSKRHDRIPRLVHRDISFGKERHPVPVVNGVDDGPWPDDFLYVTENIETSPLNINRVITSLSSCACLDECGSNTCMCSRNSLRCWYDKEGRLMEDFNRLEPPLLFECNRQCRCWSTCNNRLVQNGITCRLQLFRTEGRGWGLKTLLDIPQGTFICEYIGEMITDMEADRREDDSYLFDLDNKEGDTYCIDARRYGNIARFINHLCEPNIIPVKLFVDHQDLRFPRICFFSSRLIKAGEELGFDYSEKFWIIKWKQFTCECGSPKCRYSNEVIHKTLAEYHARMEEEYALLEPQH